MSTDLSAAMQRAVMRSPAWFPDVWIGKPTRSVAVHYALELGAEAGEVLGAIKQWNRVDGMGADAVRATLHNDVGGELADVLCNVAVLAALLDVDLTAALDDVIDRNDRRFPPAR